MHFEKEDPLRPAMERAVEDNKRIARENLRLAALSGREVIDPKISKAFLNVIREVSGKKAQ